MTIGNTVYRDNVTIQRITGAALSTEQLNALSLENCQGTGNLSFLNNLPKLNTLNITNSGLTDEQLAGFRGEHVTTLRLNGIMNCNDSIQLYYTI